MPTNIHDPEHEITFMPDRLNQAPIIFMGMTDAELKLCAGLSLVLCIPLGVLIGATLRMTMLGFGAGFAAAFALTYLLGKKLKRLKRGRPEGYHVHAIAAWLEDHGLKPQTMIRQSQAWDIVRRQRVPPTGAHRGARRP